MHILLIDDYIRKPVGDYLEVREHTMMLVNSGEAALRVLQTDPVDIVITEIMMPGRFHAEFPSMNQQIRRYKI